MLMKNAATKSSRLFSTKLRFLPKILPPFFIVILMQRKELSRRMQRGSSLMFHYNCLVMLKKSTAYFAARIFASSAFSFS